MKRIKLPGVKLKSFMSDFVNGAEITDSLEEKLRAFFGMHIPIYYQGQMSVHNMTKIKNVANVLENGEWTLTQLNIDIKNIVLVMQDRSFKLQINFNAQVADAPFLKLKEFKQANPMIIHGLNKNKRSMDLYFKEFTHTKEIVYEC